MTDAFASRNVTNITDTEAINQVGQHTNKNITQEENCFPEGLAANLKCNCNDTNNSTVETQIQANIFNTTENVNVSNSIGSPKNNQSFNIGGADTNTVLKYVYKKNDVKYIPTKTTGHPKNTLKRRKRSENFENLDETKAPLIVNYETLHGPPRDGPQRDGPQRDVEVWLPARNTANFIKHSALADFNIETLHDNEQENKNIETPSTETIPENANDSNESIDRENNIKSDSKTPNNLEESSEQNKESLENSGENEYYPRNDEKYSDSRENYKGENTNDEKNRHSSIELESSDIKNSKEEVDSKEYDKSKYTTSPGKVHESVDSSEETDKSTVSHDKVPNSEEDSNSKYKSQEKHQYKPDYDINTSRPTKLQDVDLGEYERIQVNENGEIETAKDTQENTAFDPDRDIILTTKPAAGFKKSEKISSLSRDNTDSSSLEFHDHSEPTHINDGEVKPVVERNLEVDSTESSDENSSEALKAKLENESLETLTGVNEKENKENKNDKLQDNSKSVSKSDVKQQFERIPLNYNHADKKQRKDSNVKHIENKEQSNDNGKDEGSIDYLKPRYDENLNIKFDDISIKLPDIKLPDDILSYAYEDPPVDKNEKEQKPTYYQDTSDNNKKDDQRERPIYQDSSIYNKNKEGRHRKPKYYKPASIDNKNKEEQVEKPSYYRKDEEEKQKPKFYHYSDEVHDEPSARLKQEDNDDDDDEPDYRNDYYGYHVDDKEKESYKQKQNNDEEEDLYEKFVRERFGKRGTFEKRLEKLTDYKSQNPHLYKKVQNILKKTKNVKTEADKSGDPNAGYAWTLEYGDKL